MAKFIEYKLDPLKAGLIVFFGVVLVPILAMSLLFEGLIPAVGFVAILACGIGVLFVFREQLERRCRVAINVASAKLPKRSTKAVSHTVRQFPQDTGRESTMIVASIVMMVVCLLESLFNASRTNGRWSSIGAVFSLAMALLLAAFLATSVRLRIEGDQVQVTYPFLRGLRNKTFRFGEIASVEVTVLQEGGKEVRIRLHDGSSVRYFPRDETEENELLAALKLGVAEATPAPLDWSELQSGESFNCDPPVNRVPEIGPEDHAIQ
jgi:hypothetical protein